MWLDRLLFKSPLQAISHQYHGQCLTILAYHDIDCPERFEQQIKYLAQKMRPVSLEDIIEAIELKRELPKHAVLVTFDDGYRSVVDVALPTLQRYQVPGIVFVVTALIGTDCPFWWDEIAWLVQQGAELDSFEALPTQTLIQKMKRLPEQKRALVLAELRQDVVDIYFSQRQLRQDELTKLESVGIAVGNHTHTHPALDSLDDDAVTREIETAHGYLTSILGHSPRAFAYPYGYVHKQVDSLLPDLGYAMGFLFDHRIAGLPITNATRVSRVRANSSEPLDRFAIVASGLHPKLHRLLGRR